MNDKFWDEVKDCHEYLATGGLGEVQGFVQMFADMGEEKVQNDTTLEWAILELAAEGLSQRRKLERKSDGEDRPDE